MRGSEWTPELDTLVNRNNNEVRKLLRELSDKKMGFVGRLSGKNHVIVKSTVVPMCTASFSLTPSDRRALKNKKSDVEKLIAQVLQAHATGVVTASKQ
jgi:hypothetical protein